LRRYEVWDAQDRVSGRDGLIERDPDGRRREGEVMYGWQHNAPSRGFWRLIGWPGCGASSPESGWLPFVWPDKTNVLCRAKILVRVYKAQSNMFQSICACVGVCISQALLCFLFPAREVTWTCVIQAVERWLGRRRHYRSKNRQDFVVEIFVQAKTH
jgi:hypothetical protein